MVTLRNNRERPDRLAHRPAERATLDEDEAYAAAGVTRATAPAAVARGETPDGDRVPGLPPEMAALRSSAAPDPRSGPSEPERVENR